MCPVSTAPDHPSLRVIKRPVGKKRYKTKRIHYYPCLSRGQDYNVFNSDICALERAAKERLFYVKGPDGGFVEPPEPLESTWTLSVREAEQYLTHHGCVVSPLTKDQFLGAYEGRKRTIYENAYTSLESKPLTRDDSTVKFFVKQEKTNFTKKPNSVPRGISPRHPRYHVSLGPYIKRIEKMVYNNIDQLWGAPTIMKGKNAKQRGKAIEEHWRKYSDPVAVGIDASRFDQHVHIDALKFEHRVYLSYFIGKDRKHLAKLLNMQLINRGVGYVQDGKLNFTLVGKRMSGDMNTALGNCLQMSTMVWSITRRAGVPCTMINDGDDGVIFLEKKDLSRLLAYLPPACLTYGHEVVLEPPAYKIEDIEFCQCKFVWRPNGYIAVRHIAASFDKDAMSLDPLPTPRAASAWLAAVGEGGLALTSGIPVLQEYYTLLGRQSKRKAKVVRREGFHMLAQGLESKRAPVHPRSRYSFWLAFGIAPDEQRAIEETFARAVIDHNCNPNNTSLPYSSLLRL